jgi:calcineurin-like phosphoesterase family protein
MDRVLVNNWNYTVSPDDRVYFLGDLRYGRGTRTEKECRSLLNGTVTSIRGNHDQNTGETVSSVRITCDCMEFLLVHDPNNAPAGYAGWVIHGHHHNNDLRAFPYIDPVARRINVSAEVIGYCPVSIREICQTLRETVLPSGKPLLLRYSYIREDCGTDPQMFTG